MCPSSVTIGRPGLQLGPIDGFYALTRASEGFVGEGLRFLTLRHFILTGWARMIGAVLPDRLFDCLLYM